MRSRAAAAAAAAGLAPGIWTCSGNHVRVSAIRSAVVSFIHTRTFVPGGAKGVRLKSNAPCICAWADNLGLRWDPRIKFKEIRAWGMRRSHKCNGKLGSVLHRPAMK
eukprot:scaffold106180_cov36-Attheya_sp.AAC.1